MRLDASLRTFLVFSFTAQLWKGDSTMCRIIRFLCDEEAATAVEYAVMLAMILLAVIAGIQSVGAQAGGMWGGISTNLTAVGF
jgi:pilus assembly protein Flp/PilA